MREIKFRIWSSCWNLMIYLDGFKHINDRIIQIYYKDEDGDISSSVVSLKDAIVEQYTGLKDKNGKEIYEGDILSFEDTGEEGYEYKEGFDYINQASVIFNNARWELDNFGNNNSGVIEEMNNCHEDFISVFARCEVIGNIHQNPELLEVI